MRLLSYNIQQCLSVRRHLISARILKQAIAYLRPDVVVLQEVVPTVDAKAEPLAFPLDIQALRARWPHVTHIVNAHFATHAHGIAILSRYPVLSSFQYDISREGRERRAILHATLDVPGALAPVHLLGAHFGLSWGERRWQAERVCERVTNAVPADSPVFLVGDFNDWPRVLSGRFTRALGLEEISRSTYPSFRPLLHLDRIYFRGARLRQVERPSEVPWPRLSDHLPLLGHFDW